MWVHWSDHLPKLINHCSVSLDTVGKAFATKRTRSSANAIAFSAPGRGNSLKKASTASALSRQGEEEKEANRRRKKAEDEKRRKRDAETHKKKRKAYRSTWAAKAIEQQQDRQNENQRKKKERREEKEERGTNRWCWTLRWSRLSSIANWMQGRLDH